MAPTGSRTFVGFGFGAIQAGLFLHEAFRSGNFKRLVVAEVVPEIVREIREAGGSMEKTVNRNGTEIPEHWLDMNVTFPDPDSEREARMRIRNRRAARTRTRPRYSLAVAS